MSKSKAEQDYVFEDYDVEEIINSQGFVLSPYEYNSLNMIYGRFHGATVGVFLQAFADMPASVTCLRLDCNAFGKKNVKELVTIFAAIPIRVSSLSLGSNDLIFLSAEELATVLSALPPSVTSLNLWGNELCNFTGEELAIVFASLLPTVISLNLTANDLGQKTEVEVLRLHNSDGPAIKWIEATSLPFSNIGQKLALAFAALPRTITSLDLSCNDFGIVDAKELAQAFAALPHTITSLDLSYNHFDKAYAKELAQVFAVLPPTVTTLYFSSDDFHNKTEEQLVTIFGALHNSLTSLGLKGSLYEVTLKSMGYIFSIMASKSLNLTCLDLRDNDFGKKSVDGLCKLFKTIPKSVTEINLSENGFSKRTAEELAQVFGAMPDSVTSLDLSEDNLAAFFALENEAVLCPVFRHISTLCLGDKFMASLPPQVRCRLPNVFPLLAKLIPVDSYGNKIEVGIYCDANFIRSFGVIPYAPSVQSSLSMFAPINTIPLEEVPEPENTGISCLVS